MAICQCLHPVREREVLVGLLRRLERLGRVLVLEAVKESDPAKEIGLGRASSRIREDDAAQS